MAQVPPFAAVLWQSGAGLQCQELSRARDSLSFVLTNPSSGTPSGDGEHHRHSLLLLRRGWALLPRGF